MALVLAIGGMADLLGEGEIRVLKSAHHRRVHADVQDFPAIRIARGIEKPVDRFGIGAFGGRQAQDSAIRFATAAIVFGE